MIAFTEASGVQFQATGNVEAFRVAGDPRNPVTATLTLTCPAPFLPGGLARYMCTFINQATVTELAAADSREPLLGRTITLKGLPVPSLVSNTWVEVVRANVKIVTT